MKNGIPLLALTFVSAIFGQDAAPPAAKHQEFEVAAIKPAAPQAMTAGGGGGVRFASVRGLNVTGNRVEYKSASLHDLIRAAYRMKDSQIVAPDWMSSARFDLEAKMPDGATKDDVPEMLQALLAERFKLVLHHDNKDHDVYALLAPKGTAKLQPADPNPPSPFAGMDQKGLSDEQKKQLAEIATKAAASGKTFTMNSFSAGGTSKIQMRNQTLAEFAGALERYTDRPVIDMTEVEGRYDFVLEVSADEIMRRAGVVASVNSSGKAPGDAAADPAGNTIFTSVQTYGLKLEKRKAPIDMLVIDKAEKTPTEN